MTWIDDVRKWFLTPKTLKGIAGMIVIVIVLALDFAYWAGAIDVTDLASGEGAEVVEENETYTYETVRELDESNTITAPGLGQDITSASESHPFNIEINASEAIINLTLEDGTGINLDLDLYVYAPDGEEFAAASEDADESLTLSEKVLERKGAGEWTATVKAFTGWQLTYSITGDVTYKYPLEEGEAENGEE